MAKQVAQEKIFDEREKIIRKRGDHSMVPGEIALPAPGENPGSLQQYLGNRTVVSFIQREPDSKPAEQKLGSALKSETTGTYSLSMRDASFKSSMTLSSDGKLKLDLGPVFDFSAFGLSYGPRYDLKGWKGVGQLWIGKKPLAFTTDLVVDDEGNLTLELGQKFVQDTYSLSAKLSFEKGKKSISQTTRIEDLLGMEGVDVKTSMKFSLDQPEFSQEIGAEYTLSKGTRKVPAPTLKIGFTTTFGIGPEGKESAMGIIYLQLVEGKSR